MGSTKGHYIQGEYPPDWPVISKAIKEKAGMRCERCHHPAEGPWKMGKGARAELEVNASYELAQTKGLLKVPCDDLCTHPRDGKQRMLTVDHLDGDKSNCEPWNLAALCQGCHLSVQGRVRMEQNFMFEHSDWMRPHVEAMIAARSGK